METWAELPGDELIKRAVGESAFMRGTAYARAGRVALQTSVPSARALLASVQGSESAPYQTFVRVGDAAGRSLSSGRCTCPVAIDCKHVAAVLVAARWQFAEPPASSAPSWESLLTPLIEKEPDYDGVPIGLQFEPVMVRAYYGRSESLRVSLQPVIPGKRAAWIRGGMTWQDLGYQRLECSEAHREALRNLYAAHPPNRQTYRDAPVYLDEFGPSVWPLLRSAVDAGVALVDARKGTGRVRLSEAPASVSLDLVAHAEGGVRGTTRLEASGVPTERVESVALLGKPLHGAVLFLGGNGDGGNGNGSSPDGAALVLAPLDRPLPRQGADLLSAGEFEIPAPDLGRFLAEYYPMISRTITVRSSDGTVELPEIKPPQLAVMLTYGDAHELDLEWAFHYEVGGAVRRVPLDSRARAESERDRRAEGELLRLIRLPQSLQADNGRTGPAPTTKLRGTATAVFTEDILPGLREQGVVVEVNGTPAEYRRSDAAPVVRLTASDSDSSDWFDLGVTVDLDGEEVPFERLFVALSRGEPDLVLDSGTYFPLDRPELEQLRRLIEEARQLQDRASPGGLRLSWYQAGLWEELAALGVVESQSERWREAVGGLLAGQGAEPPAVPSGVRAELRGYQVEGFRWLSLLWDNGLGGVLADDMGLGKTLQVLATILRAKERGTLTAPVLVVAPTSVVGNWAAEAEKFAPGLRVATVMQTEKKSGRPLAGDARGADVVVTSYALFRIDEQAYRGLEWSGLVLDEAQFVKNHRTKAYQCARRLAAPFKVAITGTPLENSLMDLWSMLSIVAPGMFPDPKKFAEDYQKPIEGGHAPERLAQLRRRIRPFIRRRTKEQVATDLPPKQEQVLHVQLNPRHRRVYDTHLQRERHKVLSLLDDVDKNRFTILRSLTLLRQLSLDAGLVDESYAQISSSKADVFIEHLEEVIGGGHRALVFSQFTGFLATVRRRLEAAGIEYAYLDGRTRNRTARVNEFKTGTAPVFLISLKAGGFGLNLTEADYCFVLDPWWNPAAEAQAVDRTHRIGQLKNVMVYRLVAEGTIEEKVLALQERKRDLFDKVIDEGGELSAPLSAGDIRELLAG